MEEIKVKNFIGIGEMDMAIDSFLKIVFNEDFGYKPILEDFAYRYVVIKYFTTYDIDTFMSENDIETVYKLLKTDNEIGDLFENASKLEQFDDFTLALEKSTQHRLNSEYHSNKLVETIHQAFKFFEDGANEDSINNIACVIKNIIGDKFGEE